jgi:hypothetical protein
MAIRVLCALTIAACVLGQAQRASAQGLEVAPFAGYRFGGDFFELVSGQALDLDGAPSFGITLNVPFANGIQFEGLFTHQEAYVLVPAGAFNPPTRWQITVEHWQGGGLQEYDFGRVRPFLTGTVGVTRFAAPGDNEIRFAVSAGGGVKLFPSRHIGVRLDGRVFATFVDMEAGVGACGARGCFLSFYADVLWQADFTAALVFRFPGVMASRSSGRSGR